MTITEQKLVMIEKPLTVITSAVNLISAFLLTLDSSNHITTETRTIAGQVITLLILISSCALTKTATIDDSEDETYEETSILTIIENESDKDCYELNKEDILASYPNFLLCIQKHCLQFYQEYCENPEDLPNAVAHYFCKDQRIVQCVKHAQIRMGICMNDAKKKKFDGVVNPIFATLKAICGDAGDGQPLKELVSNKGLECLQATKWKAMSCFDELKDITVTEYAKTFDEMYSKEECKYAKELQICLVNAVSTCNNKATRKFVKLVLDAFLKNSHCADYPDLNIV